MDWPLNPFDAVLVAQTYPGRPMTTHHTLEIDRPIALDGWARALAQLVREYPELGSRIESGLWPRRVVSTTPQVALRERLIHDRDGSHAGVEQWFAEPIDPTAELPIRIRVSPGRVAEQAVCLSLHHSVSDGVGALGLFDRFLALASGGPVTPRRSKPLSAYPEPRRASLAARIDKLASLRRPAAQLIDRAAAQLIDRAAGWASGQLLALRTIGPEVWQPLGHRTRASGVTRTTAIWHAVASVATRQRLDDPARPLRIIAGVDLREHLGVPRDALGNWLGTLEQDHHHEPSTWEQLHARLTAGKQPEAALVTPSLLRTFVARLPLGLARAVFRRVDSDTWPTPFSLMLAPIRVPERAGLRARPELICPHTPPELMCWPARLKPRRLWFASTMPRRPGLGLTFTQVGDHVVVAATCQATVLRRATLEHLLDEVVVELESVVASSQRQTA